MVTSGESELKINLNVNIPGDNTIEDNLPLRKPVNNESSNKTNIPPKQAEPDREFVSSLFNHNPEIPSIEQKEFEATKEDVFSARTFSELSLHPHLVKNLGDLGISTLTTIQSKALPVVMGGKDALIKSQTGSGKTLTYALPILQALGSREPRIDRKAGVFAVVIVPTRELALQSFEWFQKLCRSFIWVVPCLLVGGENRKAEKARVRKGVNILVSTPGRLVDHIEKTETFSLSSVEWLVLDEADRMLELGYEREVQKVLEALRENTKRQSLLLSATLTSGIQQLSEVSLRHPQFIDAAASSPSDNKELTTPTNLTQTFLLVPAKLRLVSLIALVLWKCATPTKRKKMLIFLATQDMVDFFHRILSIVLFGESDENMEKEGDDEITEEAKKVMIRKDASNTPSRNSIHGLGVGVKLSKLHGNMKQGERLSVFQEFRGSDSGVLLSTDVAARGLDLPQVDWICQFTAPISVSDYVHRVGRTARIGSRGSSVIFLLPSEAKFVTQLEEAKIPLAEMKLEQVLSKLSKAGVVPGATASMEESATSLQMRLEERILGDSQFHEEACSAYVSFVRSYASYPKEAREVFCFKELHLGHCAKTFALRDPPSKITGIGKGQWVHKQEKKTKNLKREEKIIKAQKRRIDQKSLIMSEYSTGFDGISDKDKANKKRKKH